MSILGLANLLFGVLSVVLSYLLKGLHSITLWVESMTGAEEQEVDAEDSELEDARIALLMATMQYFIALILALALLIALQRGCQSGAERRWEHRQERHEWRQEGKQHDNKFWRRGDHQRHGSKSQAHAEVNHRS